MGLVGGKTYRRFLFGEYLGTLELANLHRTRPSLLRPEFDCFERREDENLAVTIIAVGARPSDFLNRRDRSVEVVIVDDDLDRDLSQDVSSILNTTVNWNPAGRLRKLLRITNRDSLHADIG